MTTLFNADTSDGLKITSDTSGEIAFQSAGVTKAGVNATGLTGDASQLTGLPAPAELSTASGSAPSYSARAWVNFNGTGAVAIRDSGNVSSITDNGTGDYTVNFTTAMANNNYAATVAGGGSSAYLGNVKTDSTTYTRTISALPILTYNTTPAAADVTSINVAVFR